eukprot:TRINITY_DN111007_c0_g1_i1.p1 TRINITY_DN111007_c0_g1~~TRINITY_DN111007_c0_g1_i1.p1  ORF type:complete len:714 (-),score=119.69 TRINITY_DN111007_c0_g1_i1:255-2396(-)
MPYLSEDDADDYDRLPVAPPQVRAELLAKEWARFRRTCVDGSLQPLAPFEPLQIETAKEYVQCGSATHCDVLGNERYRLAVRNRLQTIALKEDDRGFILKPDVVKKGKPYRAVCFFHCVCRGKVEWLENSMLVKGTGRDIVAADTKKWPSIRCKWCRRERPADKIKPFDPTKKDHYCCFGGYWPRPHAADQCPPCIQKQSWCPKKLCHLEPQDYDKSLATLLRTDPAVSGIVDSGWTARVYEVRDGFNNLLNKYDALSKNLTIEFEDGFTGKFQVVLRPDVYCVPAWAGKVAANLDNEDVRQIRNDSCPDFSFVWSGSQVLLALNRAVMLDENRTEDEKNTVKNRVVDKLIDRMSPASAAKLQDEVSCDGWWRYQLGDSVRPGNSRAYHGTARTHAVQILSQGLQPPEGKPAHGQSGSDSRKSIYVSPCLAVAAFPTYATFFPVGKVGKGKKATAWGQIVFEVEVPEKYGKQQPGTLGSKTHWRRDLQFQEGFRCNGGLEWLYEDPADLRLVAILVRGFGRDADVFGTLNAEVKETKQQKPEYNWTEMLMQDREDQGLYMDNEGRNGPCAYVYNGDVRFVAGNLSLKIGKLGKGQQKMLCALCDDERTGRVAITLDAEKRPATAFQTGEHFAPVSGKKGSHFSLDPHQCGKLLRGACKGKNQGKGAKAKGQQEPSRNQGSQSKASEKGGGKGTSKGKGTAAGKGKTGKTGQKG